MAKNGSFIKLEGTIDNVTFYNKNGVNYAKAKSTLTKARIMTDKNFKRNRENMGDFGGSAKAGQGFRQCFSGMSNKVGDPYISGRVTGMMREIIDRTDGKRGERDVLISEHQVVFQGFEFNPEDTFKARFYNLETLPIMTADRKGVRWTLGAFTPDESINAPEGATHFKVVMAAGYVSDYAFDYASAGYRPVDGKLNSLGRKDLSAAYKLNFPVTDEILLALELTDMVDPVPADVTMMVGVGIIFYQQVFTELYELVEGASMRVAVVG